MLKGLIFDVDGTLIDSVDLHAHAWREILASYGHDHPFEEIRHQIGKGGDQLLPVFLSREEIERDGEAIETERSELFKEKYLPRVLPFPAVRALFERIRGDGRRIVLASSAKGDELEKYRELAGIGDLIAEQTSSDDAEKSKPHPDIFRAALAKLEGISAAEAMVIGDTPYDAEAARKAGIRCLGLLCGGFPEAELRGSGCFAVYRDPEDLLEHYDRSPIGREEVADG